MCGVAGSIGIKEASRRDPALILSSMRTRGPDSEGYFCSDIITGPVALYQTRLAILDVDPRSDQPFVKDGLVLIYNGEIYNHKEIRRELSLLGASFKTESDTETILEAYRHWGVGAEKKFEGMWAFALLDQNKGSVWLSRDRFGEKPLYLYRQGEALFFASEVKAIAAMAGGWPGVNLRQLRRYLVNGYKSLFPSDETFFEGVRELPAGHSMLICETISVEPRPYWQLRFSPQAMSFDEACEQSKELVEQAVRRKLQSDAPLAIRLSGGIDSNVIMGMALNRLGADVATFSAVSEDPRYDESATIDRAIAFYGGNHHRVVIPKSGFVDRMTKMVEYFDGPVMTISYYIHALVSEAMQSAGFKVSLGGTGADEIFSGYYDHYLFWLARMAELDPSEAAIADRAQAWAGTYGQFVRNPFLQDPAAFIKNKCDRRHIFLGADGFSDYLNEPFFEPHQEKSYCDDLFRNRMYNELFGETVPVMLHEDDLASMMFSVENRAVFLDADLVTFLSTVPTEHFINEGLPKALLRRAGDAIAPPDLMSNPRKQGINAPVTEFADFSRGEGRSLLLDEGPLYEIVDRNKVEALVSSEVSLNSESKFLFSLIAARLFLDQQASNASRVAPELA